MDDLMRADQALFALAPLVRVPIYTALEPMTGHGMRYLMAKDGLWLEVRNELFHVRTPVAAAMDMVRLPAGVVQPICTFHFGKLPRTLLEEFIVGAKAASPNETAAVGMWNVESGDFRLVFCSEDATPDHTRVQRPKPMDAERLVLDIHSHGRAGAFFSQTDDDDDRGEIKISVVVGKVDSEPEVMARLCLLGRFIPLEVL